MATNIPAKKEPLWTKNFILLSLSNFFLFMGFQMLLPTLPVFVSEHGGNGTEVGLVIALLTLSAIIIRFFTGVALETMNRHVMFAGAGIMTLLAMGGYYVATTVFAVLVLRFVHGVGWGISTTTYGAVASDIIPAARRGEGMGYFGLGSTLAMALGPFIGIWLMRDYGFNSLFICTFVSTLLSFGLTPFISIPYPERGIVKQSFTSLLARLVERQALFPSFLALLLGVTYGGIVSFITLFGKEAGIANVGWFFLVNAASIFVIRPISGKIFDKKGHYWVLLPGAVCSILGLFLLSSATSTLLLIIAAIFYGAGFGAIQPSLQAWVINRVAPARRGAANATFYNAFDLGIGGGGLILGAIAERVNYAHMYRYSILLLVVYIAVYMAYVMKRTEKKDDSAVA
ncbi:MFS transporter [Aneurinibacillus uraniidurans]|uniref:MFS transporter n=1 Tax=Aneurinibacillus uraniidurans TaxID=2966586 RepID=UPI00234911B8|nr:MFS transporter [Aneurinibacillus sp. B1]WCN37142.1 MFS transporter [Aneurinibacillus sp. B1]